MLRNGCRVNPLLQAVPWMKTRIFRVDWLHAADQGVEADFLGNLFHMAAKICDGSNEKLRMQSLWLKVQGFYEANNVQD